MKPLCSFFKDIKNSFLVHYGENPGKMLVHTGTLGWILSSLAQVWAVVFNDKIPKEQKTFLIPQEIADAAINILSFYAITSSITSYASKLVSTGKLRTPKIDAFIKKHQLKKHVGNINFNISELANFDEVAKPYKRFNAGVGVAASTVGSIISSNIITPVLRNKFASERQKDAIAKMQEVEQSRLKAPKGISMYQYQLNAARRSSGLKV